MSSRPREAPVLGALFIGAKQDGDSREIIFVEIWGKRYYVDETTELIRSYEERTTLPDSIGQLTGLTQLDLSENELTSLPDSIGNLTGLQWLYLSNNFGLLFGGVGGFPPNPRSG